MSTVCYIMGMSEETFVLTLIGIITLGALLVILGKVLFAWYMERREQNTHIKNMCWPYRIVRLGDGTYGLQHYSVPLKNSKCTYWYTLQKYKWLPDAQKAMSERMATVIADRSRVIAKEERERMAEEANRVASVLDYQPSYSELIEETQTIDCPKIDKVTIDRVCSPAFMTRPDVCSKEGMI